MDVNVEEKVESKKKRYAKGQLATILQKRKLVELLAEDKIRHEDDTPLYSERWQAIADILNEMEGIKKSIRGWQFTWRAIKSRAYIGDIPPYIRTAPKYVQEFLLGDKAKDIPEPVIKSEPKEDVRNRAPIVLHVTRDDCYELDAETKYVPRVGNSIDYCRQLIKEVADGLRERKTEEDILAGLCKSAHHDCKKKKIWFDMKTLTISKLEYLLIVSDHGHLLAPEHRMTMIDWLLFDTVLIHMDVDVIGMTDTEEKPVLRRLFELVKEFNVENLTGDELADAWSVVTLHYNAEQRQCTPMLLQRRWYQMKFATRAQYCKFWSIYKGSNKKVQFALPYTPTRLQRDIAMWHKSLLLKPFMLWEDLIKNNRVILREQFELIALSRRQPLKSEAQQTTIPSLVTIDAETNTLIANTSQHTHTKRDKTDDDIENIIIDNIKKEFNKPTTSTQSLRQFRKEKVQINNDLEENNELPQEEIELPQEEIELPQEEIELPQEEIELPQEEIVLPKISYVFGNATCEKVTKLFSEKDVGSVTEVLTHKPASANRHIPEYSSNSIVTKVDLNLEVSNPLGDTIDTNSADVGFAQGKALTLKKEPIATETDEFETIETPFNPEDEATNADLPEKIICSKYKHLLEVAIVYTVRIDDMGILPSHLLNHVNNRGIIDMISRKSKPVLKRLSQKPVSKKLDQMPVCSKTKGVKDDKRVKISSYLFKKPRYRVYNDQILSKNPDFNITLVKLPKRFFANPHNCILFRSCMPLTVDLSNEFEKKLVNGMICLDTTADDSQNKSDCSTCGRRIDENSQDYVQIPNNETKRVKNNEVNNEISPSYPNKPVARTKTTINPINAFKPLSLDDVVTHIDRQLAALAPKSNTSVSTHELSSSNNNHSILSTFESNKYIHDSLPSLAALGSLLSALDENSEINSSCSKYDQDAAKHISNTDTLFKKQDDSMYYEVLAYKQKKEKQKSEQVSLKEDEVNAVVNDILKKSHNVSTINTLSNEILLYPMPNVSNEVANSNNDDPKSNQIFVQEHNDSLELTILENTETNMLPAPKSDIVSLETENPSPLELPIISKKEENKQDNPKAVKKASKKQPANAPAKTDIGKKPLLKKSRRKDIPMLEFCCWARQKAIEVRHRYTNKTKEISKHKCPYPKCFCCCRNMLKESYYFNEIPSASHTINENYKAAIKSGGTPEYQSDNTVSSLEAYDAYISNIPKESSKDSLATKTKKNESQRSFPLSNVIEKMVQMNHAEPGSNIAQSGSPASKGKDSTVTYEYSSTCMFLSENKMLLTTAKFPPNLESFQQFKSKLKQTLQLPKCIRLKLLPNGRVALFRQQDVAVSSNFLANITKSVAKFYEENSNLQKKVSNCQTDNNDSIVKATSDITDDITKENTDIISEGATENQGLDDISDTENTAITDGVKNVNKTTGTINKKAKKITSSKRKDSSSENVVPVSQELPPVPNPKEPVEQEYPWSQTKLHPRLIDIIQTSLGPILSTTLTPVTTVAEIKYAYSSKALFFVFNLLTKKLEPLNVFIKRKRIRTARKPFVIDLTEPKQNVSNAEQERIKLTPEYSPGLSRSPLLKAVLQKNLIQKCNNDGTTDVSELAQRDAVPVVSSPVKRNRKRKHDGSVSTISSDNLSDHKHFAKRKRKPKITQNVSNVAQSSIKSTDGSPNLSPVLKVVLQRPLVHEDTSNNSKLTPNKQLQSSSNLLTLNQPDTIPAVSLAENVKRNLKRKHDDGISGDNISSDVSSDHELFAKRNQNDNIKVISSSITNLLTRNEADIQDFVKHENLSNTYSFASDEIPGGDLLDWPQQNTVGSDALKRSCDSEPRSPNILADDQFETGNQYERKDNVLTNYSLGNELDIDCTSNILGGEQQSNLDTPSPDCPDLEFLSKNDVKIVALDIIFDDSPLNENDTNSIDISDTVIQGNNFDNNDIIDEKPQIVNITNDISSDDVVDRKPQIVINANTVSLNDVNSDKAQNESNSGIMTSADIVDTTSQNVNNSQIISSRDVDDNPKNANIVSLNAVDDGMSQNENNASIIPSDNILFTDIVSSDNILDSQTRNASNPNIMTSSDADDDKSRHENSTSTIPLDTIHFTEKVNVSNSNIVSSDDVLDSQTQNASNSNIMSPSDAVGRSQHENSAGIISSDNNLSIEPLNVSHSNIVSSDDVHDSQTQNASNLNIISSSDADDHETRHENNARIISSGDILDTDPQNTNSLKIILPENTVDDKSQNVDNSDIISSGELLNNQTQNINDSNIILLNNIDESKPQDESNAINVSSDIIFDKAPQNVNNSEISSSDDIIDSRSQCQSSEQFFVRLS